MAPAASVVCPACGARNKTKWEFCARCGESLQGVATEGEAKGRSGTSARLVPTESEGLNWRGPLLTIIAVGAAVALAWNVYRSGSPQADPALFTVPTRPAAREQPAATQPGQGAESFEAGRKLLSQGDAAGAVSLLAEAVAEAPGNALYVGLYAQALWKSGAQEDALVRYREAVQLDPGAYRADYARALNLAGKKADAVREYEAAVAQNGNDYAAVRELADVLYEQNNFTGALPHLKRALELRPDAADVAQQYGFALEKTGDPAAALEVYRGILERAPDAAVTRGLLAEGLVRQGNKEEAITVLREGIRKAPDAPLLHRGLASVLERAGRVEEAAREYREYTRLAPNAEDAKTLLERANLLDRKRSK